MFCSICHHEIQDGERFSSDQGNILCENCDHELHWDEESEDSTYIQEWDDFTDADPGL